MSYLVRCEDEVSGLLPVGIEVDSKSEAESLKKEIENAEQVNREIGSVQVKDCKVEEYPEEGSGNYVATFEINKGNELLPTRIVRKWGDNKSEKEAEEIKEDYESRLNPATTLEVPISVKNVEIEKV